uniref:Lytic murein transglycosylase n=1 Tax=Desulfacinum infernum TaxID=35837 RepID=A0A832A4K7_9BACT
MVDRFVPWNRKKTSLSWAVAALLLWIAAEADGARAADPFVGVRKLLEAEGCPQPLVEMVFSDMGHPVYGNVALSMKIRESALNYDAFLEPSVLARARDFWNTHDEALHRIGTTTGVDPSVIVAILLVETRLGQNTGTHPVATTLATFALMLDPAERDRVWRMLPETDRVRWTRSRFDAKLQQRASWALRELRALVTLVEKGYTDAARWRGSYMAAVGWPQFLPSSLLHYGADGDGDGLVDLYSPPDAFASIARYLKANGWKNDAPWEQQEKVILRYNNSRPYAETILEAARRLRESRAAARGPAPEGAPVVEAPAARETSS